MGWGGRRGGRLSGWGGGRRAGEGGGEGSEVDRGGVVK